MKELLFSFATLVCILMGACNSPVEKSSSTKTMADQSGFKKGVFGYDLYFLKQYHKDLVLLEDESSGSKVIVAPAYQGRVMTSTADGDQGISFGWVNHEKIASGKFEGHMNVYGGEERFWLGPEGGQFSIYFKRGVEFTFDNWFVPKEFDTEAFTLISSTKSEARFEKEMHLENYSGTTFDLKVNRNIRLLNNGSIDSSLGVVLPKSIQKVGFESANIITNHGNKTWEKHSGLLSIWILSMLNITDKTTIVVPFRQGDSSKLGKIVTDDYFGKVPGDRLQIKNGFMLLKADSKLRSKIGLSPLRAKPLIGSYDAINNVLTIAQFSLQEGKTDYVNSLWKIQDKPYRGDAVNAYNDGPVNGKQLGRFYELESSSPAAALAPGGSISHLHRTIHLKGSKEDLGKVAFTLFGVGLEDITL